MTQFGPSPTSPLVFGQNSRPLELHPSLDPTVSLSPFIMLCEQYLNEGFLQLCCTHRVQCPARWGQPFEGWRLCRCARDWRCFHASTLFSFELTLFKRAFDQIRAPICRRVWCGGNRYLFLRRKAADRREIGGQAPHQLQEDARLGQGGVEHREFAFWLLRLAATSTHRPAQTGGRGVEHVVEVCIESCYTPYPR